MWPDAHHGGATGPAPPGRMDVVSNESQDLQSTRVVIIGGGPGGYEAALVAKRAGAQGSVG